MYVFFSACLLTAIENFILGPIVYRLNKSNLTRRWFFLCLSVGLWSLGFGVVIITSNSTVALNWAKLYYCGVIMIPVTYLHFALALINKVKEKRKIVTVGYFLSIIFLFINFFGGIVSGVTPRFFFNNISIPGPVFPVLLLYFGVYVGYGVYLEIKEMLNSKGYERAKLMYIVVASFIGFVGGGTGFLIAYGIWPIASIGMCLVWLYPLIVAYSVATVHLMDIEVFMHRTTRALIGIILFASVLYLTFFLFERFLRQHLGQFWFLSPSLVFGIGLVLLVFFIKHVFRMNEEDLSEKFSYRPILKELARRTARAKTIEELFSFFTRFTSAYAGLEYFGVLLLDNEKESYTLIRSLTRTKGRKKIPKGLKIGPLNPMIEHLKKDPGVISSAQVEFDLRKRDLSFNKRKDLIKLRYEFLKWDIRLAVPCYSEDLLLSVFLLGGKTNKEMFLPRDVDLFMTIAHQLAKPIHNFFYKKEAIEGFIRSQEVVVMAVEAKDPYTRGHSERVAEITYVLGKELGLEASTLEFLKYAARLHDIGKIAIRDSILHKEGRLTPEEYEIVKTHPIESIKMIQPIAVQLGKDAIDGILHHHENLDGTGYPNKQKDGSIHLFAKIIRCADTLDALITTRPYRKETTDTAEIIQEFEKYKGKHFDEEIIDKLIGLMHNPEFIVWLKDLIDRTGAIARI